MDIKLQELMAFTEWERNRWRDWFAGMGPAPLQAPTGGERHRTVADLIQHIFGTELRYVQRLKGETLTPYHQIPKSSADELFDFGADSRMALRHYTETVRDWGRQFEYSVLDFRVKASIRKFIANILFHEVRHWAQVALYLRLAGYEDLGSHDLIDSDALQ
jgi:uncharacterized damage-inducible protein DinB